jgi:dGTPase
MVGDLVTTSTDAAEIGMSYEVFQAMSITREFLFERVYLGRVAAARQAAVETIMETLLDHFSRTGVPREVSQTTESDADVTAVDYVAGMTDRFALRTFEALVDAPAPGLSVLG